jgi:hypothetical protein
MPDTNPAFFVFAPAAANAQQFVQYWAQFYDYEDAGLYSPNIGQPPTPERLKALFRWKMGARFFDTQWPGIEKHFIARLDEALAFPSDISHEMALGLFPNGGPVYRIFWMHCLQPNRFPIYDQHVHRAMNKLQGVDHRELITHTARAQIKQYTKRYLPFWETHFTGLDLRKVDKALWAFGRFINQKRNAPFLRNR